MQLSLLRSPVWLILFLVLAPLRGAAGEHCPCIFTGWAGNSERFYTRGDLAADSLAGALLDSLHRGGWWDARILRRSRGTGEIRYHLEPGKRWVLAPIKITPPGKAGKMAVGTGSPPATAENVRKILKQALQPSLDQGALFAFLELQEVRQAGEALESGWRLRNTDPVRVRDFLVRGNRLTNPRVIRSLCRFTPGEIITPQWLQQAREAVDRTEYLAVKKDFQLVRTSPRDYGLLVQVQELPSYFLDGSAGYVPASEGLEKGYWLYRLHIRLLNILGTGRAVTLATERKSPVTQSILLRYREPFLLGQPLYLEPHLEQNIQDSTFLQRNWGLALGWSPWFTFTVTAALGREEVFPDSLQGWVRLGMRRERNFLLAAGMTYDSRDSPVAPRRGLLWRYDYLEKRKLLQVPWEAAGATERRLVHRHRWELQLPWELRPGTVLFTRQQALLLKGDEPSEADLLRIGGSRTLRGYAEEQFPVDACWLSRLELRFQQSRGGDLHFFVDNGGLMRNAELSFRSGYGVGAVFVVPRGRLGVDLALPAQGTPSLREAKLHLRYENIF
jgi:outer membrane protein assembly factor BamA